MDKATWVGGPKDGQPVTQEDMDTIALAIEASVLVPDAMRRIHDLEAALRALVDAAPIASVPLGGLDGPTCIYCGGSDWDKARRDVTHTPACAVAVARALLSQKGAA